MCTCQTDHEISLINVTQEHPEEPNECLFVSDSSVSESEDFGSECELSDSDGDCGESGEDITNQLQDQQFLAISKLLHHTFFFLLLWQSTFKISNAAISSMLRFFKHFFLSLGSILKIQSVGALLKYIPLTRDGLCKLAKIDAVFEKLIVCPKCDAVYTPDRCQRNGKFVSTSCSNRPFPRHPQASRRGACGAQLMKSIHTKSGVKMAPKKVYPYQSLSSALLRLIKRPGFVEQCEKWRTRRNLNDLGYMADIYDGKLWKEYSDFLQAPYNYLCTLNVDWFCPFDHGRYSVGAIYLTIQNLPIHLRNRPENIILVGIIPGPSEPHLTVNSYLAPLQQELNKGWNEGFVMKLPDHGGGAREVPVRIALTCVACDIPAARKVCGFLGHRVTLGCNKCYVRFKQMKDADSAWTNYAGFDTTQWTPRTNEDHRHRCEMIYEEFQRSNTKTVLQTAESQFGLRYSTLLELPYFDPIRYTIVDPMHNLFLGTGKKVMEVWLSPSSSVLSKKDLKAIEEGIQQFVIPDGVGRLPLNITSHFGGFTADQWRNWITIYSPILLWGIVDQSHWDCWILFVLAVKLLCSRLIKISDVSKAASLLKDFCSQFESLYGEKECTVNMHMHLHLQKCLEDYGPTYSFWLFAFERYNGILGSYFTNNSDIECQLMTKFLESQTTKHEVSLHVNEDLKNILPDKGAELENSKKNAFYNSSNSYVNPIHLLELPMVHPRNITVETTTEFYKLLRVVGPFKECVLSDVEVARIQAILAVLFGEEAKLKSKFYLKFGKTFIGDDLIGSKMPRSSSSSSMVMANWPADPFASEVQDDVQFSVGEVQYFLEIIATMHCADTVKEYKLILAFVLWRKPFTIAHELFPSNLGCFVDLQQFSTCKWNFVPVHRITNRCAYVTRSFPTNGIDEQVTFACPLPQRVTL